MTGMDDKGHKGYEEQTEQRLWLALNMACLTWPTLRTQVVHALATPGMVERLPQQGMALFEGLIPGLAEKLALIQQGHVFAHECERLQTLPVAILTLAAPDYPAPLRWIPDPPLVLYVRGTLVPEDHLALAVIGSRQPSNYGKLMVQRLSTELARYGFTVVSGLARGIDSLAHQSALQAGGRTIAVLGSGLDRMYPPEHGRLGNAISAQGAVLSEFPCATKPDRWNFPRRNRIISGLTLGTLVVEASDKSGSLHTARHAAEQGREVFAVPGRADTPTSRGTHMLIKQGAKLVEGIDDILDELPEAIRHAAVQHHARFTPSGTLQEPAHLTLQETQVLALVSPEETHIETIIHASQLPAQVVAGILVNLELRGLVQQFPGKFFTRS
jgi:DNA processing protein